MSYLAAGQRAYGTLGAFLGFYCMQEHGCQMPRRRPFSCLLLLPQDFNLAMPSLITSFDFASPSFLLSCTTPFGYLYFAWCFCSMLYKSGPSALSAFWVYLKLTLTPRRSAQTRTASS